jgi:hypothetical protein
MVVIKADHHNDCWYANVSNSYHKRIAFKRTSICFGADIDPFFLQSVKQRAYTTTIGLQYITDPVRQEQEARAGVCGSTHRQDHHIEPSE